MFTDFRERRGEIEREMERGRERERERDQLPPVLALTGDPAHDVGMCLDRELNLQPSVCRMTSNQLSHLARLLCFLIEIPMRYS